MSSNKTSKSPELIWSLLFTTIFLTTPSNGEVINIGFLGMTSTGAVLVNFIGIIEITMTKLIQEIY